MQSDMRELLRIATPTAAVGAIATLVGGLLAAWARGRSVPRWAAWS